MNPRPLHRSREGYPERLLAVRAVDGGPEVLWVIGGWDPSLPAVAVVGSRAASGRALRDARTVAAALAKAGVVVVSGGALGVDGAAHEGALEAGGATVAVLGTGIDVVYPARHARLFQQIMCDGRSALCTQFAAGTLPLPGRFPTRNKVIAGLCDAVVVVAASLQSGSLHTARAAQKIGRRVLAIPGSLGCDQLIAAGEAVALHDAGDVLAVLDGRVTIPAIPDDPEARRLFDALDRQPRDVGELAARSGLSISICAALAVDLELRGLLARAAGGRYMRLHEDRL